MTPYELRYQLLQTAQERLTQRYHADMEQWREMKQMDPASNTPLPTFPSEEDIFLLAEKIKTFVEKK